MTRKILIMVAIAALALTLSPVHPAKTQAAVLAGVSPLAVPIRNLWGAPKDENVSLTLDRAASAQGWSWSRENPLKQPGVTYIQPIYPNARITLKEPVAVGDIQSFSLYADYTYTQKPTGKYNVAFDIFLRDKETGARESEIMVWLDGTQGQPILSYKGIRSDGYRNYKEYSWTKKDSFDYHSFLLEQPASLSAPPINLKALIALVKPDKDWFITEVELGTEVWSGSGAIQLNTYYIELNGERL